MTIAVRMMKKQSPYNVGEVASFRPNEAHRLVRLGLAEYLDEADAPEEVVEDPAEVEFENQLQAIEVTREEYARLLEEAREFGLENPGSIDPPSLYQFVLEERVLAEEAKAEAEKKKNEEKKES